MIKDTLSTITLAIASLMLVSCVATNTTAEKVKPLAQVEKTIDTNDSEENYIKDSISGCKVYNPFPKEIIKIEWTGNCKNGYSHGKGKATWYDKYGGYEKDTLTVEHNRGKYTGFLTSTMYDSDNSISGYISGNVLDNALHGYAEYITSKGLIFKGNFKKGSKNGYGKLMIPINEVNNVSLSSWKEKDVGNAKDIYFVVEGIFNGSDVLAIECKKEECPKD